MYVFEEARLLAQDTICFACVRLCWLCTSVNREKRAAERSGGVYSSGDSRLIEEEEECKEEGEEARNVSTHHRHIPRLSFPLEALSYLSTFPPPVSLLLRLLPSLLLAPFKRRRLLTENEAIV